MNASTTLTMRCQNTDRLEYASYHGFKLESLLSMRHGDLAETLGIDEYVATIITDSATAILVVKKKIKT